MAEDFCKALQQRLSNLAGVTYVRQDKFVLLAELLAFVEIKDCLGQLGFVQPVVPRDPEKPIDGEELPTTAKLRSEVEKFIEELARTCRTPEGLQIFDLWTDGGAGSWIRLHQKDARTKNGNYNSSNYGSRRDRWAGSEVVPSGRGALPGWVARAAEGEGEAIPAPVAPAAGGQADAGVTASACKAWAGCEAWSQAPVAPPAPRPLAPVVPVAPSVYEDMDGTLKKKVNKMRMDDDELAHLAPPPPAPVSPSSTTSPRPPRAPPPPSPKEAPSSLAPPPPPAREDKDVKRGRLKSFLLEKCFGFIGIEGKDDLFVHLSSFVGEKPEHFPGLPGMPPVGQEVEFLISESGPRPRACWARIVGPALPVEAEKVLCRSLGHVLKSPERHLEQRSVWKGWAKLPDVLQCDALRFAMQAFVPRGLQGDVPEKVLKAVEDLAVCVIAPTPEAAAEKIAADGNESLNFHLWLQQEAFLSASEQAMPAERLWIRHALRARDNLHHKVEVLEDKPWWQGGDNLAENWEPDVKGHLNRSNASCSAEDVRKVLAHLPTSAPLEVRRYLEGWEQKLRRG